MIAQFRFKFTPERAGIVERTWLVNRWGKKGRSIPTDLYLEINNNLTKVRHLLFIDRKTHGDFVPQNVHNAEGSNASVEYV